MKYQISILMYAIILPIVTYSQCEFKNLAQDPTVIQQATECKEVRDLDRPLIIPFNEHAPAGLRYIGISHTGQPYPEKIALSDQFFTQYVIARRAQAVCYLYRKLSRFSDYDGPFDQIFFDREIKRYNNIVCNPVFKPVSEYILNDTQTVVCYGARDEAFINNTEPYGFFVHLLLQKKCDGSVQQFFIMPPKNNMLLDFGCVVRNWLPIQFDGALKKEPLVSDEEYGQYSGYTGCLNAAIKSHDENYEIMFTGEI